LSSIHGTDSDDDPGRFRTTITFDEQGDGKTVITLRQLHPTKAQRDAGIGFGAVAYGYQTLESSRAMSRHCVLNHLVAVLSHCNVNVLP